MKEARKIRIFTTVDYYLPGYKSGGPVRTLSNMVEHLGDQVQFYIFTRDRDALDTQSYPNVQVNAWNTVSKAEVYYASPEKMTRQTLLRLVKAIHPDVLYLNSFFSTLTIKTLLLFRPGLVSDIPIVLAPRGEFSAGALKLKAFKKHFYLVVAHATGLYHPVTFWQASSPYEQIDIRRVMGKPVHIHVAPDLSPAVNSNFSGQPEKPIKQPGRVRIAFLSRITPKKNLHQAIQMLAPLAGQVTFDVYGMIDDKPYWDRCQKIIARMPSHIRITYQGAIPNTDVVATLAHYHFFLLPTLGENFGHAILEALTAGCPVLISDQTPWRDLESQRVGWDIPLSDLERWHAILQHCIDVDNESYQIMTQAAWRFAQMHLQDPVARQQNIDLFMRTANFGRSNRS